ncbi:UNVERIFIED_CONTAM: hypothetical protein Slati_1855600 [Sesamum latifolium]|uniref:Uncharacterized protein n=1 Tax=Sesamum latifolium TaxID=2727402 RepID=A0AAW2WZQ2_9LAMI
MVEPYLKHPHLLLPTHRKHVDLYRLIPNNIDTNIQCVVVDETDSTINVVENAEIEVVHAENYDMKVENKSGNASHNVENDVISENYTRNVEKEDNGLKYGAEVVDIGGMMQTDFSVVNCGLDEEKNLNAFSVLNENELNTWNVLNENALFENVVNKDRTSDARYNECELDEGITGSPNDRREDEPVWIQVGNELRYQKNPPIEFFESEHHDSMGNIIKSHQQSL